MNSTVSVIIASAGKENRAESILKAIDSIEKQENLDLKIIVVFNGPNVSPDLTAVLEKNENVILEYQEEPSLPNAIHYGRSCVDTEYFCFLDDDDLYIPDTLHLRCQILDDNQDIDVVASNGLVDNGSSKSLLFSSILPLDETPMEELFKQNWLASCGGLFRTKTVDGRYFKRAVKYFEWTMTAFLLALDRRIAYLDDPTFIINNTEGSLSASPEYLESNPRFLKLLLSYPVPENIKKIIKQRRTASFHNISETYLRQKKYGKAWTYHLKSLCSSQGLKYLSYTRHLFH